MDHHLFARGQRLVLRMGVSSMTQWHLFALGQQLARHLVGGDAATREASQQVRTVRLDRPDLGQVVARRLLEGLVRTLAAEQASRLDAVEGALLADQRRQVAQVHHVAEHAGHQEEGQAPALVRGRVHGHQVLVARLL